MVFLAAIFFNAFFGAQFFYLFLVLFDTFYVVSFLFLDGFNFIIQIVMKNQELLSKKSIHTAKTMNMRKKRFLKGLIKRLYF